MGVTTSSVEVSPYTWGSALVTWSDPIVGSRTWAGASTFAHNLDVTEGVALSDAGSRRTPGKRVADSVAFSDAGSRRSPNKRPSDAFGVASAVSDVASFVRKPSETLAVADQNGVSMVAVRAETLTIAELRRATTNKRLAESLFATSDSRTWTTFVREVADAITASDLVRKTAGKRPKETLGVSDLCTDQVAFNRIVDEVLSIAETYQDIINFRLGFSESFGVVDAGKRTVTKRASETLSASDKHKIGMLLQEASSFAIGDLYGDQATFYRSFQEAISALELPQKTVGKKASETFKTVGGKAKKTNGKNVLRTLSVAEATKRTGVFKRKFTDTLRTVDTLKRTTGKKVGDALKVGDELLRGADGVIDELAIMTAVMTVEEFGRLLMQDSPSSYSEFRRLIPGDYEYKEALVRTSVTSQTGDRAYVSDLSLQIDVPDVTDRGRATCTSASAAYVAFTRTFLEPPEVSLTVVGGASGATLIPRIIGAITTTGFTVGLFSTDGALADGIVSWNATGY